jgi:hypothetical protein
MRIKSYFASSVQSAITLARREFGDDVTLVTSHVASSETRHLGEYEVVFAIEETPAQHTSELPPASFHEVLSEAIAAPPTTRQNLPERLDALRCNLIELGIASSVVRALMTLIESHVSPLQPKQEDPEITGTSELCGAGTLACRVETHLDACESIPEPVTEPTALEPPNSRLSAAELAFISSVSSAPAAFAAAHGARS